MSVRSELNTIRSVFTTQVLDRSPVNGARAVMCLSALGALIYMEWYSPVEGHFKTPDGLIQFGSAAAMYYIGHQITSTAMQSLVSITVWSSALAFWVHYGWLPGSLGALAGAVFGLFFANVTKPTV